jgi:hypothetical protein
MSLTRIDDRQADDSPIGRRRRFEADVDLTCIGRPVSFTSHSHPLQIHSVAIGAGLIRIRGTWR